MVGVSDQGCNVEAMREAGDAACNAHTPYSPGFTAINQCSKQSSSPPQVSPTSAAPPSTARRTSTGRSSRRRDSTVASYLGLGDAVEPAHLVKYAPTPDYRSPSLQPTRKRRSARHGEKPAPRKKSATSGKAAKSQACVSESLRLTKSSQQTATEKSDEFTEEQLPTLVANASCASLQQTQTPKTDLQDADLEGWTVPGVDNSNKHPSHPIVVDDGKYFCQLCFDFEITARNADVSIPSTNTLSQEHPKTSQTMTDGDEFDDDLLDDDLLDFFTDTISEPGSPLLQSSHPVKPNPSIKPSRSQQLTQACAMNGNASSGEKGSLGRPLKKFISPITLRNRILAATGDEARKPIVRSPFPTAVRERSPIIGMSSDTLLRSCFRIGEAISQSCHAAKAGKNVLLELYARILSSERDELQQRFTFCDLFHAKQPYIQATYAAVIWKSVQLFEYDSARLMQQGRICRCIGTMRRDGKDWAMTVMNIWEATWDDVLWVEGIVNY